MVKDSSTDYLLKEIKKGLIILVLKDKTRVKGKYAHSTSSCIFIDNAEIYSPHVDRTLVDKDRLEVEKKHIDFWLAVLEGGKTKETVNVNTEKKDR